MRERISMKSGDEYDAFTAWRRLLHWKPGELRKIKRRWSKRVRRKGKVGQGESNDGR